MYTHQLLQVTTTLVSMSDTVMVDTNVDAVLRPLTEKTWEVQEEMLFKPWTPAEREYFASNELTIHCALNITSNDIIITFIDELHPFLSKVLQLAIRWFWLMFWSSLVLYVLIESLYQARWIIQSTPTSWTVYINRWSKRREKARQRPGNVLTCCRVTGADCGTRLISGYY